MRIDISSLCTALASDIAQANAQCEDAARHEQAIETAVLDSSSGDSTGYRSMRAYFDQVARPAATLQVDFLLALHEELHEDVRRASDLMGLLGSPIDTEAIETSIARHWQAARDVQGAIDTLHALDRSLLGPLLAAEANRHACVARDLQARLDEVYDYIVDTEIYAASSAYASRLAACESALLSVRHGKGGYSLDGVDLSLLGL